MPYVRWSISMAAASIVAACSPGAPLIAGKASVPTSSLLVPQATVQELMTLEIDPAADFIWGSVGTVITKAGSDDREPRTDAQWDEVKGRAIILIEATNLLVIPERRVARTEFPSDGPGVLSSHEIQRKLDGDRASFDAFALALRGVGWKVLDAVDHRDTAGLSAAGEAMDAACEACHVANWYPHEVIPKLPDFDRRRGI
jgi:hypothetical protein